MRFFRTWLIVPCMLLATGQSPAATSAPDPVEPSTRVTILVDAFGQRADLRKDWGYAVLVEHDGLRILFDTGNDAEIFRHNVEALGIDLRQLDFIVVSHRHNDHTDGLHYLLRLNPQVTIYAPRDEYFGGTTPPVFFRDSDTSLPPHMRYFDGQVPDTVPHGSPWKHAQIRIVESEFEPAPGIRLVSNLSRGPAFSETPELSLSIDTPEGQILLVGCSHPGIEQILDSVDAKSKDVRLLIGGLHWVTMPEDEIEGLVRALHDEYEVQAVAPGHCTSEPGFAALSRLYAKRYVYAGLGTAIEP